MKKNLVQFMHHSGSIMCKNRRHPPGEEGVSTVSKMGGGNVQGEMSVPVREMPNYEENK